MSDGNRLATALGGLTAIVVAGTALMTALGPFSEGLRKTLCSTIDYGCTSKPETVSENVQVSIPTVFSSTPSVFRQVGSKWRENTASGLVFMFNVEGVKDGYLYLVDPSRNWENDPSRPLTVRIPLAGGMSQLGFPNPYVWSDLYFLHPES